MLYDIKYNNLTTVTEVVNEFLRYIFSCRPISEESDESDESDEDSGSSSSEEDTQGVDDEEKGNLLHYLGYRKEDRSCPEGWVMDIYGYCR